ncbi:hypothetical protein CAPTEDRAFT_196561 [Capitella teleta]|uniref:Uncharacterized protein n=1 Tax=Capitella teleta TaxID=283909 RepID=R7T5H8_CAPTE|nr:hypothetical protein CAPTEDRAFT_196561 [Capitella teleta]|eukprot:ELT88604.1 hypothetical protein CAPTEDRAFT_196561 [Capitella teleta]
MPNGLEKTPLRHQNQIANTDAEKVPLLLTSMGCEDAVPPTEIKRLGDNGEKRPLKLVINSIKKKVSGGLEKFSPQKRQQFLCARNGSVSTTSSEKNRRKELRTNRPFTVPGFHIFTADDNHAETMDTHSRHQVLRPALWPAIDWKGNFDLRAHSQNDVSDERFREHFEDLLNPLRLNELDLSSQATSNVRISVLDNDIEPIEIAYAIQNQLKTNAGCGPDEVAAGRFKALPTDWFLFLTSLLNAIFHAEYPLCFARSRMVAIFKKGARDVCDNYRDISIMSSIANI